MVTTKSDQYRKREYIVIKHGQSYYYARLHKDDADTYVIMANCSQKEAKEIAHKANMQSNFNKEVDEQWQERPEGIVTVADGTKTP